IVFIVRLLGLIPGAYPALLDQPQRREIEPLSRPCTAPLADPQPSLVAAAAALHQVQPHRLAVGGSRVILPRVPHARPQDTRRGHTRHLPLGLEPRMSLGYAAQVPLRPLGLPPGCQGLLRVILDLTPLPFPEADSHARTGTGQQVLDLLR